MRCIVVAAVTSGRRTDAAPPATRVVAGWALALALGCSRSPPQPLQAPMSHDPVDPDGRFSRFFEEPESLEVLTRLKAAVEPESARARLADARLTFLDGDEIQAGAGCTERTHRPFLVVTRGLASLVSALAEAVAVDAVTGGDMVERLRAHVVDLRGRRAKWAPLPIALVPPALRHDPAKMARQRAEFDAMMAFVMAHELSHHARGHSPCMHPDGGVELAPMAKELDADESAGHLLVRARPPDPNSRWTEVACLRVMTFLDAVDRTRGDAASPFTPNHPPWSERRPVLVRAMTGDAGDARDAAESP